MTTHDITKLVYKAVAIGFAIYNFAKGNTEKLLFLDCHQHCTLTERTKTNGKRRLHN